METNPIVRRMVAYALGKQGWKVREAADAKTALALVAEERPDLVLLDLILPDRDGYGLLADLRAATRGKPLPILAFSSSSSGAERERIAAHGFDDVLSKPIDPARLARIVEAYLPADGVTYDAFGKGRRVLVADEDPLERSLLRARLRQLGFDVVTAEAGPDALLLARTTSPDAILAEVLLPRLDGFGLCLELRRDPTLAFVPLVLYSATAVDPKIRDLARSSGAADLIKKGTDGRALIEALREVLARRQQAVTAGEPATLPPPRTTHAAIEAIGRDQSLASGVARRRATMSEELAVLTGIFDTFVRNESVDAALDEVLSAFFDAGGIPAGALYLMEPEGGLRARSLGRERLPEANLTSFFGRQFLVRRSIEHAEAIAIPSPQVPDTDARVVLEGSGARSAVLVPLLQDERPIGALLLLSRAEEPDDEAWIAFAQGVAGQIGQTLRLARALSDRAASERQARKHARHARESAELLRTIIESIPDAVVAVDEEEREILSNAAFSRLIGPKRTAAAGGDRPSPDGAFSVPPDQAPLARARAGETIVGVDMILRGEDGAPDRWIEATARPLFLEEGVIGGAIAVYRDVTARKDAEAQILAAERLASVGSLAAGVAHEINNPLAAVIANLDLAIAEASQIANHLGVGAELEEELADAREAAGRVRTIVRDLKVFSRSSEDVRRPVDVERVLESTIRMAWNQIRHRARLVRDFGEVGTVEGNEPRLGQVFLNLIVNAAEAIPEGRADTNEIRVATRALPNDRVAIEISDSGTGIAPAAMKRLFTPFWTTKTGTGTGLGLSICHKIVTGMGGRIEVDSELGRGTTFRVVLPKGAGRAPMPTSVPPPISTPRRGRILVVDDEPAIGAVVVRSLGKEHDVTAVNSGSKALDLLATGASFDVILCDVMMPEISGPDLFDQIALRFPEHTGRMVFMTGGAFTGRAAAFLESVSNAKIDKPFGAEELRQLIAKRLGTE